VTTKQILEEVLAGVTFVTLLGVLFVLFFLLDEIVRGY